VRTFKEKEIINVIDWVFITELRLKSRRYPKAWKNEIPGLLIEK